jgi:hypothetical protein
MRPRPPRLPGKSVLFVAGVLAVLPKPTAIPCKVQLSEAGVEYLRDMLETRINTGDMGVLAAPSGIASGARGRKFESCRARRRIAFIGEGCGTPAKQRGAILAGGESGASAIPQPHNPEAPIMRVRSRLATAAAGS